MPKIEGSEPSLSASAFSQRCKTLAARFSAAISLPKGALAFADEITNAAALMTLAGRASEKIARNQGAAHHVVPVAPISEDVFIWTGYREYWEKHGKEANFRFVEGGFTLHLGRVGELAKPQILRSEWVGRRSRAFVEQAGHPHWQMDVLESARAETSTAPARFDERQEPPRAVEFGTETEPTSHANLLLGLTVESMHLASVAPWWDPIGATIAHTPKSVPEVDRWVLGCIAYLLQEVRRCKIVVPGRF